MSGYEAAICRLFDVSLTTHQVGVEVSGGGSVQLGEYTWDTEPHQFEVFASVRHGFMDKGLGHQNHRRVFGNFSDALNALLEA